MVDKIVVTTFAPVVIPTLCRYQHFRNCLETLAQCTWAEYTEVYVGLDYPLNESHCEGYDKEMVKFIMGTFDKINDFEKRTNGISKENMLYKNVYDYWMYGFRPDQQFYCKHSIAFLSAFSI